MSHLYNLLSYTKLPCPNIQLHFGEYKTFLIQNLIVNIIFRCKYNSSLKYETLLLITDIKFCRKFCPFVISLQSRLQAY